MPQLTDLLCKTDVEGARVVAIMCIMQREIEIL